MTRRGNGLWQQSITINGRRVFFYGKTKAEVNQKILAYNEKAEFGEAFKQVAEAYWKDTESELSPTTVNPYKRGLNRAIEYFGDKRIKEIERNDIKAYQLHLIQFYDPSEKTLKNLMIVLRQIFKWGIANGKLRDDPSEKIPVPGNMRKGRRGIASDPDVRKIIEHRNDCRAAQIGYIALMSGMRKGEILALTHKDIDFNTGAVQVNKSAYYTSKNLPQVKEPKTEAGNRTVFLPVEFVRNLTNKPFIFSGDRMIGQKQYQVEWHKYCEQIGIHCTIHQLRHNFASNLDEAGNFTDKEMQYLLGHADVHTTKQVYQELRKGRIDKLAEKVAQMSDGVKKM